MIGTSLLLAASRRSTLLDGLVGYWPLNGNGNDVLGVSNGTVEGTGSSWGAGKINQAFYAGGAARVNLGGNSQIKPTGAISVGGWFWFNGPGGGGRWCSDWHQDGAKDRWIFPYAPSNQLYSHFNSNVYLGTIGVEILANTWVHLMVTATVLSTVRTYLNGSPVATGTDGSLSRTGPGNVCVGMQEEVAGGIDGRICEFSMWNTVKTPLEITEWYNAGAGKTHPFN